MKVYSAGPWRVRYRDGYGYEVLSSDLTTVVDPETGLQSRADADLIAAAPDLLVALTRILDAVDEATYGLWQRKTNRVLGVIEASGARKAVARAEGRQ